MDPWLDSNIKEALSHPTIDVSSVIGEWFSDFRELEQPLDERVLTAALIRALHVGSKASVWGRILPKLHRRGIEVVTEVGAARREHVYGADLGIVIDRISKQKSSKSKMEYACLVQCKKVDSKGRIADFFHEVPSTGQRQSSLMLSVTPSSFYFIFVDPDRLSVEVSEEPLAFVVGEESCYSPLWGMGCFAQPQTFPGRSGTWLEEKARTSGSVLVVPALAVDAQFDRTKSVKLREVISNSIPFWYWFSQLLIPGFIGDPRPAAISVAASQLKRHLPSQDSSEREEATVRQSLSLTLISRDEPITDELHSNEDGNRIR